MNLSVKKVMAFLTNLPLLITVWRPILDTSLYFRQAYIFAAAHILGQLSEDMIIKDIILPIPLKGISACWIWR